MLLVLFFSFIDCSLVVHPISQKQENEKNQESPLPGSFAHSYSSSLSVFDGKIAGGKKSLMREAARRAHQLYVAHGYSMFTEVPQEDWENRKQRQHQVNSQYWLEFISYFINRDLVLKLIPVASNIFYIRQSRLLYNQQWFDGTRDVVEALGKNFLISVNSSCEL